MKIKIEVVSVLLAMACAVGCRRPDCCTPTGSTTVVIAPAPTATAAPGATATSTAAPTATAGSAPTATSVATATATTAPSCRYAVQQTPQHFTYKGGDGGFSVSTNPQTCTWQAVSNDGWIGIDSQTKAFVASLNNSPWASVHNSSTFVVLGAKVNYATQTVTGNGSVTYIVAGNDDRARTGTISVGDKTVTIVEGAAP